MLHDNITPGSYQIVCNNQSIFNDLTFQYLGVTWGANLEWEAHITKITKSVRLGINMLASLCKKSWGIHPQTALIFYKSIVRLRMDWASYLFANANYFFLQKLQVLQNSALRICLGSIRTTPINVLHHLSGIPTLKIRRCQITERMLCRDFSFTSKMVIPKIQYMQNFLPKPKQKLDSPRISSFGLLYDCWKEVYPIIENQSRFSMLPTFLVPFEGLFLDECIDVDWGRNRNRLSSRVLYSNLLETFHENTIIIHSDGAVNKNGKRGIGYFIESLDSSISLNACDQLSVLSCELGAILEGISDIRLKDCSHLVVFTDSLLAANSLRSNGLDSRMHPLAFHIRSKIIEASNNNKSIRIYWSPKALSIPNSFKADLAAKQAFFSNCVSTCSSCTQDILPIFKKRILSSMYVFCNEYGNFDKGRKYMNQVQEFYFSPCFCIIILGDICILNRLRSGHNGTRAHLASTGFKVEEMCSCGDDIHSIHHLIWDCKELDALRCRFFAKCRLKKIPWRIDIVILAFHFPTVFIDLLKFIKEGKIPV